MVGAVRRRIFSVVSAQDDPQQFMDGLGLDPAAPLTPAALLAANGSALPAFDTPELAAENEAARKVQARKNSNSDWKSAGVLQGAAKNIGLCVLRTSKGMNKAEAFKEFPVAA